MVSGESCSVAGVGVGCGGEGEESKSIESLWGEVGKIFFWGKTLGGTKPSKPWEISCIFSAKKEIPLICFYYFFYFYFCLIHYLMSNNYLGHTINNQGVAMQSSKIMAVKELASSSKCQRSSRFLGPIRVQSQSLSKAMVALRNLSRH